MIWKNVGQETKAAPSRMKKALLLNVQYFHDFFTGILIGRLNISPALTNGVRYVKDISLSGQSVALLIGDSSYCGSPSITIYRLT